MHVFCSNRTRRKYQGRGEGAKKDKPTGTITKHEIRMRNVGKKGREKERKKLAIFQFVDQTQFNSLYPPLTTLFPRQLLSYSTSSAYYSFLKVIPRECKIRRAATRGGHGYRTGWGKRERERGLERWKSSSKWCREKGGRGCEKSSLRAT